MADDYRDDVSPPADKAPLHGSMHDKPYGGSGISDTEQALRGIKEEMLLSEYQAQERFEEAIGEDESRPEWLPANFKTGEALAKSYNELRRAYSQSREEAKANAELLAEMQAQQYADDPVDVLQQLAPGVYDQEADESFYADEPDASLAVEAAQQAGPRAAEAVWANAVQDEEVAEGWATYVETTMSQLAPDWSEVNPLIAARITENNLNIPADPPGRCHGARWPLRSDQERPTGSRHRAGNRLDEAQRTDTLRLSGSSCRR
jgi:hypothetical protein